jgi:hypothetical protein
MSHIKRSRYVAHQVTLGTRLGIGVLRRVMCDTSVSTGMRKELGELFRWCHVSEGLARAAVEAGCDAGQVGGGVQRQSRARIAATRVNPCLVVARNLVAEVMIRVD